MIDVDVLNRRELQYLAKELALCRANAKSEVILNLLKEFVRKGEVEEARAIHVLDGMPDEVRTLNTTPRARKTPKIPNSTPSRRSTRRTSYVPTPNVKLDDVFSEISEEKDGDLAADEGTLQLPLPLGETIKASRPTIQPCSVQVATNDGARQEVANTNVSCNDEGNFEPCALHGLDTCKPDEKPVDMVIPEVASEGHRFEEALEKVVEADDDNNNEEETRSPCANFAKAEIPLREATESCSDPAECPQAQIIATELETEQINTLKESFAEEDLAATIEPKNEVRVPARHKYAEESYYAVKEEIAEDDVESDSTEEVEESFIEMPHDIDIQCLEKESSSFDDVSTEEVVKENVIETGKSSAAIDMSEIETLVNSLEDLQFTDRGKIHCKVTGHDMIAKKSVIAAHLGGKKFLMKKKLLDDLTEFEPMFVPHPEVENMLLCQVTGTQLRYDRAIVMQHIAGTKYQSNIDAWNQKFVGQKIFPTPQGKKTYFSTPSTTPVKMTHWSIEDYSNDEA